MSFRRFEHALEPTAVEAEPPRADGAVPGFEQFMDSWAGATCKGGLYRVHVAGSATAADAFVAAAFPALAERVTCFGFDWLGRQFALDAMRVGSSGPEVLLIEPGTGDVLEIPCGFTSFHEEELVDHVDAALAASFFDEWSAANEDSLPLPFDQCAGYLVPLFFGGQDTVKNLEIVHIEDYWDALGKLRRGVALDPPQPPHVEL